jgi:hypothetical protein
MANIGIQPITLAGNSAFSQYDVLGQDNKKAINDTLNAPMKGPTMTSADTSKLVPSAVTANTANDNGLIGGVKSFFGMDNKPLYSQLGFPNEASLNAYKQSNPVEYNTMLKSAELENTLGNAQPGMLENIGTGLSAFSTAYGLYDNLFGTSHDYAKEKLGALRDQRSAFNQSVQDRKDFRDTTSSALNG